MTDCQKQIDIFNTKKIPVHFFNNKEKDVANYFKNTAETLKGEVWKVQISSKSYENFVRNAKTRFVNHTSRVIMLGISQKLWDDYKHKYIDDNFVKLHYKNEI